LGQGARAARGVKIEVLCSLPGTYEGSQLCSAAKIEREQDGRWIGEVPGLPGVLAYGPTEAEARVNTAALALRVIADRIEHGEAAPFDPNDLFIAA
jgi:predicted RNase H-like HicB family nuclease